MSWTTQNPPGFTPSRRLGNAVKVLLVIVGAIGLADVIQFRRLAQPLRFQMTMYPGGTYSSMTSPSSVLGPLASLSWLTLVIVWLIWQHRVTANTGAKGRPAQTSPGWAVGWWFVPIANLFMPVVALYHVYKASREGDKSGVWLLVGWWLMWVGVGVLAVVALLSGVLPPIIDGASRIATTNQPTIVDLTDAVHLFSSWLVVAAVSQLIAAGMAIVIVSRIDTAQPTLEPVVAQIAVPVRPDLGY